VRARQTDTWTTRRVGLPVGLRAWRSVLASQQCRLCADIVELIHAGSLVIDDIEDGAAWSQVVRSGPALDSVELVHDELGVLGIARRRAAGIAAVLLGTALLVAWDLLLDSAMSKVISYWIWGEQ
jgi:geranylgeranyl pyrophosphate synthase